MQRLSSSIGRLYLPDFDLHVWLNLASPQNLGGFRQQDFADSISEASHNWRGLSVELSGKIQIVILRKLNPDGPRVCSVMTVCSVGVELTTEFESDFIETELAVSILQDFPALIRCAGCSQFVSERAELELGFQLAAEVSAKNHTAGHVELRISEVLNSNPNANAKENGNYSAKTLMRKILKQRKSGTETTDYVNKNDNLPGRKATSQKFMMNVASIGAEYGLVAEESADDRESRIQKWNRERDEGSGHAKESDGLVAPKDAVVAQ
jgi:hypothetical protein